MWIYAVATFVVLAVYLYFKLFVIPKRRLKWYKQTMENLGYKVFTTVFEPFSFGLLKLWQKDQQQKGDVRYTMIKQFRNYDVVLTNALNSEVIFFLNPQLIKDFYSTYNQNNVYPKERSMIGNLIRLLGQGVAFSEGDSWKKKRKVITSVFNFEFIKSIFPKISEIAENRLKQAEQKYFQNKKKQKVVKLDLINFFSSVFSTVMTQCFFGSSLRNQKINDQPLFQFLGTLLKDISIQENQSLGLIFGHWIYNLGLRSKDRSINLRTKLFRQLCKSIIDARVQQINKESNLTQKYTDIIQALLKNKLYTTGKQKEIDKYDFNQLIDQFSTFLTAGTDTTAHFTTFLIYYLCQNPRVMEKVRLQIDQNIKSEKDFTYDVVKNMKYIDYVQNETTRIYGPGTGVFLRKSSVDHHVVDIPLLKNSLVGTNTFNIHYNPKYYENPEDFIPERWQNQCKQTNPFTFVGFSAGPRTCIGKQLALLESKIAVIKLLKRYKKIAIPKNDFKIKLGFLMEPEYMLTQLTLQ